MTNIFISFLIFGSSAFASDIECAIQTRDPQGISAGAPVSFGTMKTLEDEIRTSQQDYDFYANKVGDSTVAVVITDQKHKLLSSTIGGLVSWQTYTVIAQSMEGTGQARSGTVLCKLK